MTDKLELQQQIDELIPRVVKKDGSGIKGNASKLLVERYYSLVGQMQDIQADEALVPPTEGRGAHLSEAACKRLDESKDAIASPPTGDEGAHLAEADDQSGVEFDPDAVEAMKQAEPAKPKQKPRFGSFAWDVRHKELHRQMK